MGVDLRELFAKENLNWEKFAKRIELSGTPRPHRATLRRNVLALILRLNNYLDILGYEVYFRKKKTKDESRQS